jgi:hypothetical protein
MIGYSRVNEELVAENSGTVILGDTQAYQWFEENDTTMFADIVHPNTLGHAQLGTFRATAIKSALEYQINPDYYFLS